MAITYFIVILDVNVLLYKYMKNFFKKIAVLCGIIAIVSFTVSLVTPSPTYAEGRYFLGMPAWDNGVNLSGQKNEDQLVKDIATIAVNILTDLTVIAAYLVLGYVIWGGYQYMFSSGDPGKAAAGKKTITQAFIGLAITVSAYAIFGAIRTALIGDTSLGDCALNKCVDPGEIVTNTIQWVIGMGGVVAVVFVVVGAWGYMTAAGDPGKLQKAKTTIAYALIGLAIVAFAEVVTAFVSSTIRNANEEANSYLDTTQVIANINKESL